LESGKALRIIEQTQKLIADSRKEGNALKKKPDLLSRTRSGKVLAKPLSKKQKNYLQSIPKDTISAYLIERKQDLRLCT